MSYNISLQKYVSILTERAGLILRCKQFHWREPLCKSSAQYRSVGSRSQFIPPSNLEMTSHNFEPVLSWFPISWGVISDEKCASCHRPSRYLWRDWANAARLWKDCRIAGGRTPVRRDAGGRTPALPTDVGRRVPTTSGLLRTPIGPSVRIDGRQLQWFGFWSPFPVIGVVWGRLGSACKQ